MSNLIFDEEIISLATGFMVGPIGARRGKAISAGTMRFDSLDELKQEIKKLIQEKEMFLYMVTSQETITDTKVSDLFVISDEEREKLPKKTSYIFRGEFLDKQ